MLDNSMTARDALLIVDPTTKLRQSEGVLMFSVFGKGWSSWDRPGWATGWVATEDLAWIAAVDWWMMCSQDRERKVGMRRSDGEA